jgi:hypothetical protein
MARHQPSKPEIMDLAERPRRNVLEQPESVDFIENRLAAFDPAFQHMAIRYDAPLDHFVPAPQSAAVVPAARQQQVGACQGIDEPRPRQIPARPLPPGTGAMRFWDQIFEKSMEMHRDNNPDEPEKLAKKPQFSIRGQHNWDSIYNRLQNARVEFDSTKSAFWGRFKKGYRRFADGSGSAYVSTAFQVIPDHDMISPVKAALEVVLEVSL